jgi:hypothetical protein
MYSELDIGSGQAEKCSRIGQSIDVTFTNKWTENLYEDHK